MDYQSALASLIHQKTQPSEAMLEAASKIVQKANKAMQAAAACHCCVDCQSTQNSIGPFNREIANTVNMLISVFKSDPGAANPSIVASTVTLLARTVVHTTRLE